MVKEPKVSFCGCGRCETRNVMIALVMMFCFVFFRKNKENSS